MTGYRFHGLAIAAEPVAGADPVEALLGPFRDDSAAATPALHVSVRPWTGAARAPAVHDGALFRHGDVTVGPGPQPGARCVSSPRAVLHVGLDGAALWGTYAPPADGRALELLANVELFVALALALHARGLFHLHAAALVAPSGDVLAVAGTASCGKSTLATALVAAGCAYLGDDVVFVARREGAARLLAFPRPFHLAEASARAIPATLPGLLGGDPTFAGKRWLDAGATFPGAARQVADAPSALLFPEIADAEASRVEPLGPAEALGALLASSLFATTRLGSPAQRALLAELAGAASGWRVILGRDLLADATGTAGRLLRAVGSAATARP